MPAGRQDLYRGACLVCVCLLFVAVTVPGLAPPTRTLTLFFLAGIFSITALYELSVREVAHHWMLLCVLLLFALAGIAAAALAYLAPARIEPRGPLRAAGDAAPKSNCGPVGPDDLVMLFGPDRVIGRGKGAFAPIRIGTCPALTLRPVAGGLSVNAFGYDSGDDVVYRIRDNEFHMVLRGFAKSVRPDASTLVVSDDEGRETLFVHYLNRNTVRVRGTFRCGDTHPVVISDNAVAVDGRSVSHRACVVMDARAPYGIAYSGN